MVNGGCLMLAVGRVDRLVELQRHFAEPKESTIWLQLVWFVAGAVALAAVLAVAHRWVSRRSRATSKNAGRLLRDVLRALRLPLADRLLVKAIAQRLRLTNPVAMLLSPALLAQHGHRWAGVVALRGVGRVGLARLDGLCRRLFNQALPGPEVLREKKEPASGEPG